MGNQILRPLGLFLGNAKKIYAYKLNKNLKVRGTHNMHIFFHQGLHLFHANPNIINYRAETQRNLFPIFKITTGLSTLNHLPNHESQKTRKKKGDEFMRNIIFPQ